MLSKSNSSSIRIFVKLLLQLFQKYCKNVLSDVQSRSVHDIKKSKLLNINSFLVTTFQINYYLIHKESPETKK